MIIQRQPGSFVDECIETVKWFPVLMLFCIVLTVVVLVLATALVLVIKVCISILSWALP